MTVYWIDNDSILDIVIFIFVYQLVMMRVLLSLDPLIFNDLSIHIDPRSLDHLYCIKITKSKDQ